MEQSAPSGMVEFDRTGLDELVARAQSENQSEHETATEELLVRFRPLLRARMHALWPELQGRSASVEWSDVENQVTMFFLSRLRSFRSDAGVYFPHYIAKFLELDCRSWKRELGRGAALPFSQMHFDEDEDEEPEEAEASEDDRTGDIEQLMALKESLAALTPNQREAIWQCCVLGRTENEVADELELSRSAIRNRLESALTRLRRHFEEANESYFDLAPLATRTGRASQAAELRNEQRHDMSRQEQRPDLVGIGAGKPVILRGIFEFEATGLKNLELLSPKLRYLVPAGRVLGIRYVRAGVSCDKLVCLATVVNGDIHRLFPLAANSSMHVPLAIVEPLSVGNEIEIHIASDAPGTAIIDVGFLEMPA
ncbi:MAG TPA: sigma-70 family RNA polymerase sigma factor [Abditibacteriaceae bacterium]